MPPAAKRTAAHTHHRWCRRWCQRRFQNCCAGANQHRRNNSGSAGKDSRPPGLGSSWRRGCPFYWKRALRQPLVPSCLWSRAPPRLTGPFGRVPLGIQDFCMKQSNRCRKNGKKNRAAAAAWRALCGPGSLARCARCLLRGRQCLRSQACSLAARADAGADCAGANQHRHRQRGQGLAAAWAWRCGCPFYWKRAQSRVPARHS